MLIGKNTSIKIFFILNLFFVLTSISTNWMVFQLSFSMKVILSFLLIIISFKFSYILFYFLLYCYFFRYSLNGSFLGIELDGFTNYIGMVNMSDIVLMALVGSVIIQGKYKRIKININSPIIYCLLFFLFTQLVGVVFSSDILISYSRLSRLFFFIIFSLVTIVYEKEIKLYNIMRFMTGLGIMSGILFIYNLLIIDNEYYQDDGNIIYLLPFVYNSIFYTKNKFYGILAFIHGLFTFLAISFLDIRRFILSNIIFINNVIYRFIKIKRFYFISIFVSFIFLLSISEFLEDSSELRIFQTINSLRGMVSFGMGDTAQEDIYNLFTRRDIMFAIGIEAFLSSPIIGVGTGMSEYETGKLIFGDHNQQTFRLHNLYLELMADTGIIGLIAYLIVLLIIIKTLYKFIKSNNAYKENLVMSYILLDIFIMTSIINFFGARGPYDKYEWFFYTLVYIISTDYLKIGKNFKKVYNK